MWVPGKRNVMYICTFCVDEVYGGRIPEGCWPSRVYLVWSQPLLPLENLSFRTEDELFERKKGLGPD